MELHLLMFIPGLMAHKVPFLVADSEALWRQRDGRHTNDAGIVSCSWAALLDGQHLREEMNTA